MESSLLLPLFPLELVLFPGQTLALHIFEERYKEMIGECLEDQTEFGIVLAKDNSIVNQGCTAVVTSVTRRYDDGRMDIEVGGRRRFEVLFLDQERSFLRAAAQFFDDDEGGDAIDSLERKRVLEMHTEVLELLFTDAAERRRNEIQPEVEEKSGSLSFAMVGPLPVDNDFKQMLLGLRSEPERMERVTDALEKLLSHLKLISKVRARAGANGHGR
jgi:Lon protease-like protein